MSPVCREIVNEAVQASFMKKILLSCLAFLSCSTLHADDTLSDEVGSGKLSPFEGVVTAINSNMNEEGRCFTAWDAEGRVKVFSISSLKDLDVGDHVTLKYWASDRYPLKVKTIQFRQP